MEWFDVRYKSPPKDRPFLAHLTLSCDSEWGDTHVCFWDYDIERFSVGIPSNCSDCEGFSYEGNVKEGYDFKIIEWIDLPKR